MFPPAPRWSHYSDDQLEEQLVLTILDYEHARSWGSERTMVMLKERGRELVAEFHRRGLSPYSTSRRLTP